ncbi:pitrilysin family protein [Cocleimonas sp. KMM 6892]|uniref:M16 family metallopeptidase n=1 Tax=unclassified Cocleimonas TaxID=2639732 RepID=UPI002DBDEE87|nr:MULTISPECIES: pitrilysin family protein [unclassified Cocleimonas]MEB8431173.1 pitrilysin family protein [Cocleimonas sp. KMM 6892]MEC4714055.1 pitrilysin family protein [Cocleimonas sp. KMM 6895]MEC4743386.1 pitrilysin family protein [Cocleimonas sp. KMM 6896]
MNRSLSPETPARISFLSILLLSLLSLTQPALAENENPVHEYELDNGLKVLVKQDKRAPVAVIQVWYRIGTSYEYEGITGLSHALEHMMFKGTKKYKSGEFEKMVSAIGARNNAFTSQDYTAYYEVLASDKLEDAMEIEADRMRNLVFDPAEFKKEIEVVKEERRWRTDDKPSSLTREQFNAVAFLNSPYRAPVIGWMVDLEGMKLKDAKEWYKKWYTPNNATLVVVGDVEPEKVFDMAKKYFSVYASNDLPEVKARTEVAQKGKRNIELKLPAKLANLRMGFKTPGMISAKKGKVPAWEPYALEVLANILDGGDSARFAKNLVRGKEIAASAGAGYYGYGRLDNLLVISGVPANGVKTSDLKKSLLDEINILKTELVSDAELKRVKAQVIAGEVFERDSIQHMATLLGSLESVGLGHKYIDQYVPGVLAVTAKQIQEVANKYLIEDTLTVAELIPLPLNSGKKPAFKAN